MKKHIKINESQLRNVIKKSVIQVLNEQNLYNGSMMGGSANGAHYAYNGGTVGVNNNIGGSMGINGLDKSREQMSYDSARQTSQRSTDAMNFMNSNHSSNFNTKIENFVARWNRSNPNNQISIGTAEQWYSQGKLTDYGNEIRMY